MEIRRFGVGHRRPDGPPRTTGVAGQVIHADARGTIVELAFARGASMEPHMNLNSAWFVVIEGGGWVQVGDETARVAAGEAVLWPGGLDHAAWSELSEMRAIVVELAGPEDAATRAISDGQARRLQPGGATDGTGQPGPAAEPAAASGRERLSRRDGEDGSDARTEGEPL